MNLKEILRDCDNNSIRYKIAKLEKHEMDIILNSFNDIDDIVEAVELLYNVKYDIDSEVVV